MYLEIASERPVSIVEGVRLLRLEEVVPSSTAVSGHDKTICAALVMDSMVKDIAETEGRKYGDVLKEFVQSQTYLECLFRQEINREELLNVSRNAI